MVSIRIKRQEFFFRLGELKAGDSLIKEFFDNEGYRLWWAFKVPFYYYVYEAKQWKLHVLANMVYRAKKFFDYSGRKIENRSGTEQADVIFFNTAFKRSSAMVDNMFLSPHFQPLEKYLNEYGIRSVEISYVDIESRIFPKKGLFDHAKRYMLESFIEDKLKTEEDNVSRKALANWNSAIADQQFMGQLSELCREFKVKPAAVDMIMRHCISKILPETYRYVKTLENSLQALKPKAIVILGIDDPPHVAALLAAKKQGVKTIEIPHGLRVEYARYPSEYPLPDLVCSSGKTEAEILNNEIGYPLSSIRITGIPRFDFLGSLLAPEITQQMKEKYDLQKDCRYILWATAGTETSHDLEDTVIGGKQVCEAVSKTKGWNLIIKLHPDEKDVDFYKKMAREFNIVPIVFTSKNSNVNELLAASECSVIKNSTVGFESILQGRPVLLMKMHCPDSQAVYGLNNVSRSFSSADELGEILSSFPWEGFMEARESFIGLNASNVGNASDIVAGAIVSIVAKGNPNDLAE